MFRRPLSYQGATRALYPYPLQANFTNDREEMAYRAVDHLDQSLALNALNTKALALKSAVWRHLGQPKEDAMCHPCP